MTDINGNKIRKHDVCVVHPLAVESDDTNTQFDTYGCGLKCMGIEGEIYKVHRDGYASIYLSHDDEERENWLAVYPCSCLEIIGDVR